MKLVTEKYFCDLCDREVTESNNLVQLSLSGHEVAASSHDICWDCIYSFAKWKADRKDSKDSVQS